MLHPVSTASLPGSVTVPNEDWYTASATFAVVLDGVTCVPDDGCVHGSAWYAATLGAELTAALHSPALTLDLLLEAAIARVAETHQGTCDLSNPLTPGAQVAIVRETGPRIEYLVLGDAAVAWQAGADDVQVVCDDRVDRLPNPPAPVLVGGVRRYPSKYVATVRNRPGGFYVAAADPSAARQGLTGSIAAVPGLRIMLCSDGLTRLIERFGWSWQDLMDHGIQQGVPSLVDRVREYEQAGAEPGTRGKGSDDATGVYLSVS
jgi:hypothetical protein